MVKMNGEEMNGELTNGDNPLEEEDYKESDLYCANVSQPLEYNPDMVCEEEVLALAKQEIPPVTSFHPVFMKFIFSPREVKENDAPLVIMAMMKDLDMIRRWCVQRETLARFILMAKRGYQENAYHNWKHAFSVTHFAYLLLKNCDLVKAEALSHLEAFALFVSAICHDLDHRGTNNAFQTNSKSPLATLYPSESSVLERHHVSQALAILHTEGCNILANLTQTEEAIFERTAKKVIMASDIVNHFRILPDLMNMLEDGSYNPKDEDHHDLIICLFMTACDLSDQTKDWKSAIAAAGSVYREFLNQGDLEKKMGIEPMKMMNREYAVVTDLQVGFIDKVATPVYAILSRLFPKASDALRGIKINSKKWRRLQFLYSNSVEDPEMEHADPCDLQAIINNLDFEGAEREY